MNVFNVKYFNLSASFGLYVSSFVCLCKLYALTRVTIVSFHRHKPLNAYLPVSHITDGITFKVKDKDIIKDESLGQESPR